MKNILFIVLAVLVVILIGVGVLWELANYQKGVSINTDKKEYTSGDVLTVAIKSKLDKRACFSSCYPYYLERETSQGNWESYKYQDCGNEDSVENCVEPGQTKTFELTLPELEMDNHRLAIPICLISSANQEFKAESWFYSNKFVIK